MPSPFPGMDPWLEDTAVFPDFHSGFIAALRAAINAALPPPFYAALSTRVYMEASERHVEPDVDVLTRTADAPVPGGTAMLTALETELLAVGSQEWPSEEMTEGFVEVRTTDGGGRLVTSVELLSITNKTRGTAGRGLFQVKQRELQLASVNLVEIDLLRTGVHATLANQQALRRLVPRFTYHVAVTRTDQEVQTRAAAIELTRPLPKIPIPLTPAVPAVAVDLQPVFDRTYDESLFARRIRYDQPPGPPLPPEHQAWADGILKAKGLVP